MLMTGFPEAPARLLDLIFQRGDFDFRGARATSSAGKGAASARLSQHAGDRAVRKYAQGALDRARDDIAGAQPGERNNTMNAVAYGMGAFVALGALSEREVMAALQDGFDAWSLSLSLIHI